MNLEDKPILVRDLLFRISMDRNKFIDEQFRILLNPRPRWVPKRLWHWLIRKVIRFEQLPSELGTLQ